MSTIQEGLNYSDIKLVPRKCVLVGGRDEADIAVRIPLRDIRVLPIMPANMTCSTESYIHKEWAQSMLVPMHRFTKTPNNEPLHNDIDMAIRFYSVHGIIDISVGVGDADFEFIKAAGGKLHKLRSVTIDIAHGHSRKVLDMAKVIKDYCGQDVIVIAGNVGSVDGYAFLRNFACIDIVKVGIGSGYVCTTSTTTGFGCYMASLLMDIKNYRQATSSSAMVIADGGIREIGDIAKAIACGADFVMIGGEFAKCLDSPAATIEKNGVKYKRWHGSSSEHQKGHSRYVEGIQVEERAYDYNYAEYIAKVKDGLKSAVSYAGGSDLSALRLCNIVARTR